MIRTTVQHLCPGSAPGAQLLVSCADHGYHVLESSINRRHAMGIHRLNHAVLYVGDLKRSVAFYTEVLGFRVVNMTPDGFSGAAFLQAPGSTNDHDLGLFEIGAAAGPSEAGRRTVGLYHLAWEVDTLDELERIMGRLVDAGSLV